MKEGVKLIQTFDIKHLNKRHMITMATDRARLDYATEQLPIEEYFGNPGCGRNRLEISLILY
jgi:hypothetical protein